MKMAELLTMKQSEFDALPTIGVEIQDQFKKLHSDLCNKLSAHYNAPVHLEQHGEKLYAMMGDGVLGECKYGWGYSGTDFMDNNISVVLSFMPPAPPVGNYKDRLN